jgi:cytochrome c-type biogenesis protein CcmH/NrfF
MAKKTKKRQNGVKLKARSSGWHPSYWMIVALIVIFFSAGVMVKALFSPAPGIRANPPHNQYSSRGKSELESQVRLVSANFRCGCGGCGELFLIDCTCDMPRGAREEKDFIRNKLKEGFSVEEVITLVEKKYGHRIT